MPVRSRARLLAVVCAACCAFPAALAQTNASRRPLTHQDYDQWRTIQGQTLSRDGRYLAYALFPQDGDGEVVVRDLKTGEERREPVGARPTTPPRNTDATGEEGPPQLPGVRIAFTGDGAAVVFSTFPAKAEVQKARKERRPPAEMPRNGLVILDLKTGSVFRAVNVRSFQAPEKGGGFVAYLKEPSEPGPAAAVPSPSSGNDDAGGDQGRRAGGGTPASGTGGGPAGSRPEYGSDMVVHSLADHSERTVPDVSEMLAAKDGKALVYAVSSRNADANGVYLVGADLGPARRLAGGDKGKFQRLIFDEEQTRLMFLASAAADAAAGSPRGPARYHVQLWNRGDDAAREILTPSSPGFPQGMLISDRAPLTFTRDGKRIFFGYAKPASLREPRPAPPANDEERVDVDLWHWRDDFIQPMQKIRAEADRRRAYRAVLHLDDNNRIVALGDEQMEDVSPAENGLWALGSDTRAYRRMVEYDQRYSDLYLIDTRTGERKPALKKYASGVPQWSPDASRVLYFDGKDWNTLAVATGGAAAVNLTSKLNLSFNNEEHDSPSAAPSYGGAGWTKDGKWVLVYDRFDIWQLAPDGSAARNLTDGIGRKEKIQFRVVRTDPEERWIDPAKPLLLRAENDDTYESGFWRDRVDSAEPPRKLVMAARAFQMPIKAKDADVFVVAASTFREFGDLHVTDASFRELRKVSNANPQQERYLWGTAELLSFQNADGVPLQGVLYKPDNFDPKKKYPLLVYIYERLSSGLYRYIPPAPGHSINVTYYVSNGYLVLLPDIVYTIGYPGASAMKAVLPAIQAVVDRGIVDENAIGIQGHSWGGYQIAYMITQTNRFRAVAAGAPVANMVSAYDGIRWGPGLPRQFQYEKTQSRIGGTLWDYPMRFVQNSPIFWADRVKTPLMMLHNDADDAVPWYQGIEYYLALRRLGKEVYLFTYNGEPHGIRRRPNQKDYTVRLQEYFDHFLKGAPKPAWMEKGRPYLERLEEQEGREAPPARATP